MNNFALMPFEYSEWDGHQELMQFYNVEFLRDCGPFRKGYCYAWLAIDYDKGILTTDTNLEFKVKLVVTIEEDPVVQEDN